MSSGMHWMWMTTALSTRGLRAAGPRSMLTSSAPSAGLSMSVGGRSGSSSPQGRKRPCGTATATCPTT
uniref:Alternative protein JMJD4 n=1 Tax=Homo sapiens TaxID=9606 RepID=L8ECK0_HUMAN|nr:alternative protein JMJD4 [Homo sapiens]